MINFKLFNLLFLFWKQCFEVLWTSLDIVLISKDTLLQELLLSQSVVVLQTSRSEPMILCAVNQPMLLSWATLLKINFHSFSMKKSNNIITYFRLKLNVKKLNILRKKVQFVSFPLTTEIITCGRQFYFRWQVFNALFIYREKSFFFTPCLHMS